MMDGRTKLFGELLSLGSFDSEKVWSLLNSYQIKQVSGYESFDSCVSLFITAKECEGLSKVTLNNYSIALNSFHKYIGDTCPANIDVNNIRSYVLYLKNDKGLKLSSVNLNLAVLRIFFSWLENEHLILENPTKLIKSIRCSTKDSRHPLSMEEQNKAVSAITNKRDLAIYSFFVNTGCRLSEVSGLRKENVNFSNNSAIVFGKGSKYRTVYFDSKTAELIKESLKENTSDYLFCHSKFTDRPLTNAGIEAIIRRIGQSAHLSESLYPHKLRHTFATNALNSGMDITIIQKLLGHEDLSTTQIYAELNMDKVKEEYNKYF